MSQKKLINKPWGHEEVLLETQNYVVLRMFIKRGEETSLHRHIKRDEHFIVVKGKGLLIRNGANVPIKEWDVISVKRGELHKWVAYEDLEVIEVTSQPLNDLVRVEDRYGRATSGKTHRESDGAPAGI